MARLFLIRHGEPQAAWVGAVDDPGLTERGRAQAEAAAEALAEKGPLQVVSSPMRRCLETAAPFVARIGVEAPGVDQWFGEVATPEDVTDRRAWLMENFPWRAEAEPKPWTALDSKLRRWREDVLHHARMIRGNTAVFTHFIATNVIVGAAMESRQTIVFRPDYTSITELELVDGAFHVRRLGVEMGDGEVR